jgi:chromate transporter
MLAFIIAVFKLGFTALGGPAVAYAMMHQAFVTRRKWLSEDQYFKFLGIANLIPGPNATELVMLIGHHHVGWWGVVLGGVGYILPAMAIVLVFSWMYVQWGTLPEFTGILYGIKPVIVAILLSAILRILKPRVKKIYGLMISVSVLIIYLLGVNPFYLLVGGGIVYILMDRFIKQRENLHSLWLVFLPTIHLTQRFVEETSYNLIRLFWVFLKAGALMYGSGYVLLAFIYDDLVLRLGWLTESQLLDAIAIGQVTPGPLATTATFVGYVLGGLPGALLATLAMFLPSFIVTWLVLLVYNKIQSAAWVPIVLEGISFAALGLMAGVTWEVTGAAIVDPLSAVISVVTFGLLIWKDVGAPWLVLGGALIGLVRMLLGG